MMTVMMMNLSKSIKKHTNVVVLRLLMTAKLWRVQSAAKYVLGRVLCINTSDIYIKKYVYEMALVKTMAYLSYGFRK